MEQISSGSLVKEVVIVGLILGVLVITYMAQARKPKVKLTPKRFTHERMVVFTKIIPLIIITWVCLTVMFYSTNPVLRIIFGLFTDVSALILLVVMLKSPYRFR